MTTVEGNIFTIDRTLWEENHLSIARCLGFNIRPQEKYTSIIIDLDRTFRSAFETFIDYCAPFSKEDEAVKYAIDRYEQQLSFFNEDCQSIVPYWDKLFDHQKQGVFNAMGRYYSILAFEQGLGKTITAATLSLVSKYRLTVVICPALVKYNWYRDLISFGYDPISFTILDASPRRSFQSYFSERFIILNYDIVGKFSKMLLSKQVDHIILDEAHMLKNHNAKRYKATVDNFIKKSGAKQITALTGTPIKNRINDMFALLKINDHPLSENYAAFIRSYTHTEDGKVGAAKNIEDLRVKISNVMFRKTKEECLDLPEKLYSRFYFDLDDYKDEYDKVITQMMEQSDEQYISSHISTLNIITSKAKVPGVVELIREIIEEDEKVIVFSSYLEPMRMIEKEFHGMAVSINGSVSSYERDQRIQRFINDPETKIFLGQTLAAGVGINLVNCSNVIFLNLPFTPSDLNQAIDRAHRMGQSKSVKVYYTIAKESIDEDMYELVARKAADIDSLIDSKDSGYDSYVNVEEELIKKILKKDTVNEN